AEPDEEPERRGQEEAQAGREDGRDEKPPLPPSRDAAPPEERRERGAETGQPANERHVPEPGRRPRHGALAKRPVATGEGPEALADDHHPVRPRHAAQARKGDRTV